MSEYGQQLFLAFYFVIIAIVMYILITLDIILKNDCFLNPLKNYNKWITMNWFGIGVITILLNIIFLPYAIIYWIYKLFHWLFTVGRKSD